MLVSKNFNEISSIQASLFLSSFVFSTYKILKTVIEASSELFDGDPIVLPIPDDAPREIPRIILKKKDNTMKLELSPLRFNFFRTKTGDGDEILVDEFLTIASKLLSEMVENIEGDVVRMAVVLERFCPNEEPPSVIADHFCKSSFISEPFDRPSGFELHSLKKYKFLDSFEVNSWVRIKSGISHYEKELHRPVIVAHQDINTLAELMDTTIYIDEDISKFFNNIFTEFDKILGLYFPLS
ncbi:MAG: hypothetical protein Q8P24_10280 [Desulfobacterales bacterium]|nr:hypothetical protein [Desulfobacterales bacterium]